MMINPGFLTYLVFYVMINYLTPVLPDESTYQKFVAENPLPVAFGDPFILKASDGIYYMTGTGGVRDGFKIYSSADLRNWKDEGRIYSGNLPSSWGISSFWAPELYEIDGRFVLLFSADWRYNPTNEEENFRIGVAVSDRPTGPYTDLYDRPLFDPGYPVIDGNLLIEGGIVTGTGHNCVTFSTDGKQMLCVYHARTSLTGNRRVVFIDEMELLNDGTLVVKGPTTR